MILCQNIGCLYTLFIANNAIARYIAPVSHKHNLNYMGLFAKVLFPVDENPSIAIVIFVQSSIIES
jgi:hypothetical protein